MKRNHLLLLFLFFYAISIFADNAKSDSTIVIWEEHFDGWYDQTPSKGKNASYEESSLNGLTSFSDNAHGRSRPELALSQGYSFVAKIYLYGATGNFTLKFKVSDPNYILVYLIKNKKETLLNAKSDGSYIISAPKNSKYITLEFRRYSQNVSIDDIQLIAPANCRKSLSSPELSFSDNESSAYLGEEPVLPSLINPHNLKVRYWSTDKSIADISNDGKFNVKDVGETTIYAICEGGTDSIGNKYSYQEVSYKLKVKRRSLPGEIFYEGFSRNLCKGGYKQDFSNYSAATSLIKYDNKINEKSTFLNGAYRCIYLGSANNQLGNYVIGPFKGIKKTTATLSFKVAGSKSYTENPDAVSRPHVTVYKGKNKVFSHTIDVAKQKWETRNVEINDFDENSIIYISGTQFYLDDVSIVIADSLEEGKSDDQGGEVSPGDDEKSDDQGGEVTPGDEEKSDDQGGEVTPGDENSDDQDGEVTPGDDENSDDQGGEVSPGDDEKPDDQGGEVTPGDVEKSDDQGGEVTPGDDEKPDDQGGEVSPGDDEKSDDQGEEVDSGDEKESEDDNTGKENDDTNKEEETQQQESTIEDVTVTISKYGYTTLYYSDRALIVPFGMTAYTVKVDDNHKTVIPSKTLHSGDAIAKNEGVILQAEEGTYTMTVTTEDIKKDDFNQLSGSDIDTLTVGGTVYYKFGEDKNNNDKIIFYWGADNGAAFVNAAHNAYLPLNKLEEDNYNETESLPIVIGDSATSLRLWKSKRGNRKYYNLSGQKVDRHYRGIVIADGKKFLKK